MEAVDDWIWQKQLRYYLKSGGAVIKMSSARFGYSYEYQGNAPKLVHTPLTDKCYLTLTQVTSLGLSFSTFNSNAHPRLRHDKFQYFVKSLTKEFVFVVHPGIFAHLRGVDGRSSRRFTPF